MIYIEFAGKRFCINEHGFLRNPNDWMPEWAQRVGKDEGIPFLTGDHCMVIRLIRKAFFASHETPSELTLPTITNYSIAHLKKLFPCGMVRSSCRLAGLPTPYKD